jgi:hypothetical protein
MEIAVSRCGEGTFKKAGEYDLGDIGITQINKFHVDQQRIPKTPIIKFIMLQYSSK